MKRTVAVITKQEAATRQLAQSIRLFFQRGDMLSVHTLAAASYQLLADLGKREGVTSPLRYNDRIRPERMKEWLSALARTENYLKHADRDAEKPHDYAEAGTVFLMFEALVMAARLLTWESRERVAFETWFIFEFPHLVDAAYLAKLRTAAKEYGAEPGNRDIWGQWLSKA